MATHMKGYSGTGRATLCEGPVIYGDGVTGSMDEVTCAECLHELHAELEAPAHDGGNELRGYQVGGDHYKRLDVQPWDVFDCWPLEQRIGAYRANATKYLMRMGAKGSAVEDARKARQYLEKLIEVLVDVEA